MTKNPEKKRTFMKGTPKESTSDKERRTERLELRVTPEENAAITKKARHFASKTAMVLHAVRMLDERSAATRYELLADVAAQKKKQNGLLGNATGNLNDIAHYCNILLNNGEVNTDYIRTVVVPMLKSLQTLSESLKSQNDTLLLELHRMKSK